MGIYWDWYNKDDDDDNLDFGFRGFVLPDGRKKRASDGQSHPDVADIIVAENADFLKIYKKIKERGLSIQCFQLVMLMGCILTDDKYGTNGAVKAEKTIRTNMMEYDIRKYCKRHGRAFVTDDSFNDLFDKLQGLIQEEGINKPDGR